MDDQKTMVVSVHAKDCVDYQCRRCGQCCRHIKDAVMVESMDAYRLANYLRGCDPNICTIMLQWQRNSCARKWAIPRKP